jgi:hypothetical protein
MFLQADRLVTTANRKKQKRKKKHLAHHHCLSLLLICSWRTPFFDTYFQVFSFCAEEEFYLIMVGVQDMLLTVQYQCGYSCSIDVDAVEALMWIHSEH